MGEPGAVPKITELRVEALHADGSRVYLTFLPETNDTLRVEVEQLDGRVDAMLDGLPTGSLVRDLGEGNEHHVRIKGVALMHVERLVRVVARR